MTNNMNENDDDDDDDDDDKSNDDNDDADRLPRMTGAPCQGTGNAAFFSSSCTPASSRDPIRA